MEGNSAGSNSNQAEIQTTIKRCYDKNFQSLHLNRQINNWKNILQCQNWTQLKTLTLYGCQIGDPNIKIISDLSWPNLQNLSIKGNPNATDLSVRNLVRNELPKLVTLDLWNNSIGDRGFELILSSQHIMKLSELRVFNNIITWLGLRKMPQLVLQKMRILDLDSNQIGSIGIKYLVKADLPTLSQLIIDYCQIGNEGFKNLTKSNWPNLKQLSITNNSIGFDGHLNHSLTNHPNLTHLKINTYFATVLLIQPINILQLASSKWSSKIEVNYNCFNRELEEDAKKCVSGRFTEAEV